MSIYDIPSKFYLPQYYQSKDQVIEDNLRISQLALHTLDRCRQQQEIIAEQKNHIDTLKSQVEFLTWYIEHGHTEIWEEW